jgi:hypothetical protein
LELHSVGDAVIASHVLLKFLWTLYVGWIAYWLDLYGKTLSQNLCKNNLEMQQTVLTVALATLDVPMN